MAIEEVVAFRTADGKLHGQKSDAYDAERQALLDLLPTAERARKERAVVKSLRRLVGEVREWLKLAEASLAQMDGERDPDLSRRVQSDG